MTLTKPEGVVGRPLRLKRAVPSRNLHARLLDVERHDLIAHPIAIPWPSGGRRSSGAREEGASPLSLATMRPPVRPSDAFVEGGPDAGV